MANLDGKVIVVFGATSGIGLATARTLADCGANVILTGRRTDRGEAAVSEIAARGGRASFLRADVSSEDEVAAVVDTVVDHFGRLDAAFNNAGVEDQGLKALLHRSADEFDTLFNTNVRGLFFCMKHEMRVMAPHKAGAIVNNSSTAGIVGVAGFGLYAASKHAVEGLTKSASLEMAPLGIRVNAIQPYGTESELLDRSVGTGDSPARAAYLSTVPMRRFAAAAEPAHAVAFLCSDESAFITGASLPVDGGMHAGMPVWVDLV